MTEKNDAGLKSKSSRLAVAAIDFGTTYSGYAFSWKYDWAIVHTNEWHAGSFMSSKAPTTLLLNPDKTFFAFGYEAENIYRENAEKISSDSDSESEEQKKPKLNCKELYYFQRFKMLLHKNKMLHRDCEIYDMTGKPMRAMDVFSHCIRHLKDTMIKVMTTKITFDIKDTNIDFVLTVPAIWGDAAKLFMREAAIKAGIKSDQLTLALEPEAASIYCQYLYMERKDTANTDAFQKLVDGKAKYMVADLGGGTVDITVHKKAQDGTLEELIPATGGTSGGTTVDIEYEKFIEKIAGEGILKSFANANMEDYLNLLRDFESKKREVKEDSKLRIKIPLAFDKYVKERYPMGIKKALQNLQYGSSAIYNNYKLCLEPSVFLTFFKKAAEGVIKCMEDILTNEKFYDVRDIILVGGFSECTVIQKALREKFRSHRFIIPMEPGLAVLKGAVYFGHLPNAISRRVARFTYGVQICPKFKPGEHPENKKISVSGTERCKDVLHPLVKRGEQIKPGLEIATVCHSLKPQQGRVECGIYISDRENPKFVDEKGCRLLGKLTVTIPQGVYSAEIEEVIVFGETEITFRARQLESGKSFEASFDMLDAKFLPDS